MKFIINLMMLFAGSIFSAEASVISATQGDVITVEAISDTPLSLHCFGRSWPAKRSENNQWHGWIGVDLKKKPGSYTISWKNRAGKTVSQDQLTVAKGEFRISHIEVAKKMAVFDKETLARIRAEAKVLKATYVEPVDANPDIMQHGKPVEGIESTPFGAQRYVNGEPRSPHSGIDIAAPAGTAIVTPLAGKVLMVAHMYLNGKTVAIGHGNGLVSVFSHMQSTDVKNGDWVKTRQKIGEVGATGRATGPHLHWGIRFHYARVNPETLL